MNQTQTNVQREDQSQLLPARRRARSWHNYVAAQNLADRMQIPKCFSDYGFRYYLESPISTAQCVEEDRITYMNRSHFYGIVLEYRPDPNKPLTSRTVKSVVMLTFRDKKSPDDEVRAWKFWHSRQKNVKQRILDAATKNSVGLVCIEEISYNAIALYWNPLESLAKIHVAVQCLSTDFTELKGVKGTPFHLQIDTYDLPGYGPVCHRGYCQIKVFCDKGAERKARYELRAVNRKKKAEEMGKNKFSKLYHLPCERSEFYSMIDIKKPAVLFSPAQDIDMQTPVELQESNGHVTDTSNSLSNGEPHLLEQPTPFLSQSATAGTMAMQTPNFHHQFPSDTSKVCNNNIYYNSENKEVLDQNQPTADDMLFLGSSNELTNLVPPINERVVLYVRQYHENVYTPLHVIPPTTQGLLNAIEAKYSISASRISNMYKKTKKRIIVKIDDDMIKYYCNKGSFLLEVMHSEQNENMIDIILIESIDH